MKLQVPPKAVITALIVCFVITAAGGILTSVLQEPYFVFIRLKNVTWPPTSELTYPKETHIQYGIPMTFEIWNPFKRTFLFITGNQNLLDPQMHVELEENYTSFVDYIFLIFITEHEIKPGIEEKSAILTLYIENYNDSIPAIGNYTIWAKVDGNTTFGEPPFNNVAYKTTIHHNYNASYLETESIPENWGDIYPYNQQLTSTLLWSMTGVELVTIIIFLIKRKKKKLETFVEIQI